MFERCSFTFRITPKENRLLAGSPSGFFGGFSAEKTRRKARRKSRRKGWLFSFYFKAYPYTVNPLVNPPVRRVFRRATSLPATCFFDVFGGKSAPKTAPKGLAFFFLFQGVSIYSKQAGKSFRPAGQPHGCAACFFDGRKTKTAPKNAPKGLAFFLLFQGVSIHSKPAGSAFFSARLPHGLWRSFRRSSQRPHPLTGGAAPEKRRSGS
jgi:hypothetical protein